MEIKAEDIKISQIVTDTATVNFTTVHAAAIKTALDALVSNKVLFINDYSESRFSGGAFTSSAIICHIYYVSHK